MHNNDIARPTPSSTSSEPSPRHVEATRRTFNPWPHFDEEQIEAVTAVLRSGKVNYWTGTEGRRFEEEFAQAVEVPHAVALANGSVALELALVALNIGPGDEVVVPCRTFVASASSVALRGARPVFADIDRDSQNVTAQTIEPVLTPRTKAIIAVHLAGWPCDLDPIMELAQTYGLRVIEDCAQAHGATYHGRPVGSIGDVAAFSFCQDKILTTGGEGGILTTKDPQIWRSAWSYKDHGKSWDEVSRKSDAVFRWLHENFGTNWRMTEMQSALGRVVLKRLSWWVQVRRRNAAILQQELQSLGSLRLAEPPPGFGHSYYKFYAFVRPELLNPGWTRDRIVRTLQTEGLPCGSGSCGEVYRELAFERAGLVPPRRLPVARELAETSLMFLVHPTLSTEEMQRMAGLIRQVVSDATVARRAAA